MNVRDLKPANVRPLGRSRVKPPAFDRDEAELERAELRHDDGEDRPGWWGFR